MQPFLVIEASRLRRPLMTMGWLEEILFLFSVTLNRVGDSFKAIEYIFFLFGTLNRVGWLLYCSICAAQLFRLLRTKCRFIKQVSHFCIGSPPEFYATYLPSPLLCCHSWTFTRWCSSLAGPGVPQAQARPSLHSVITYIHSPLFSCPLGTWPKACNVLVCLFCKSCQ